MEENLIAEKLELAASKLDVEMTPVPRAIISEKKDDRNACYYSNFCGSYGCFSGAKGSSRAALINDAVETGNCKVLPNSKVVFLETNGNYKLKKAWYYDKSGKKLFIEAKVFIVACQAIESARLLLISKNKEFPNGLANNSGQVGKNILFSGGGSGSGSIVFNDYSQKEAAQLKIPGLFVNRSVHNWYEVEDEETSEIIKGGIVDFLWEHANPVTKAIKQKWDGDELVYGMDLKKKIKRYFTELRRLRFEIFTDWLPIDDCKVTLSTKTKDKWGDPVAKVRLGEHPHNNKIGKILGNKAVQIMKELGAKDINWGVGGNPPKNLQAGGCRFGEDPRYSVLDKFCKAHEVDNLYVTDGSFMPTGGSSTYTWTIYANSFRVADHLKEHLT